MRETVVTAFASSHDGYSADRVIADPDMNKLFVAECRRLGREESAFELNMCLLNARKASELPIPTSKRTVLDSNDDYSFASEMAIRFLEQREELTLDRIICDPYWASEFDILAHRISPGFTPLEYRWAALQLRKSCRLSPELVCRVLPPESVTQKPVDELEISQIPKEQGVYLFFTDSEMLYVGEAQNLRKRLKKHLDHSDNKGLAEWIWSHGKERLCVELRVLPDDTDTRARRAVEMELIRSRKPRFNVVR